MQRFVVALLLAGCKASTGAIVYGGLTVAAGVSGGMLVAKDHPTDREYGGGVLLCSYAVLGVIMTISHTAAALESEDATFGTASGSASSNARSASDAAASYAASPSRESPPEQRREDSVVFDRAGASAGRIDRHGQFYDKTGASAGRVDRHGQLYDKTGASAGRVDGNGHYYDETGASAGRIDSGGSFYDKTGASAGRIDGSGNVYDKTGAFAGRVDRACDDACRRIAVGRILLEN